MFPVSFSPLLSYCIPCFLLYSFLFSSCILLSFILFHCHFTLSPTFILTYSSTIIFPLTPSINPKSHLHSVLLLPSSPPLNPFFLFILSSLHLRLPLISCLHYSFPPSFMHFFYSYISYESFFLLPTTCLLVTSSLPTSSPSSLTAFLISIPFPFFRSSSVPSFAVLSPEHLTDFFLLILTKTQHFSRIQSNFHLIFFFFFCLLTSNRIRTP